MSPDRSASPLIVLTTTANQADAQRLASGLIAASLAACVQIDGPLESHYVWDGKLCQEVEYRCVIKTTRALSTAIETWLQQHHPYQQPQILMVEATASAGYARWLRESVRHDDAS